MRFSHPFHFRKANRDGSSAFQHDEDPDKHTMSSPVSVDDTVSTLSSTTFPMGTTSGRVIMRIGETILRGAEKLNIERKLRSIDGKFKHSTPDHWSSADMKELLELQRCIRLR